MASSNRDHDITVENIRLWSEEGWWIATDLETGVTTQGSSRAAALDNLDEAVALFHGAIGREPTEDELRAVGIDPSDNTTENKKPLTRSGEMVRRVFSGYDVLKVIRECGRVRMATHDG